MSSLSAVVGGGLRGNAPNESLGGNKMINMRSYDSDDDKGYGIHEAKVRL